MRPQTTAPTAPRAACIMASQSTRELDGAVERVGFGRFQVPMRLALWHLAAYEHTACWR